MIGGSLNDSAFKTLIHIDTHTIKTLYQVVVVCHMVRHKMAMSVMLLPHQNYLLLNWCKGEVKTYCITGIDYIKFCRIDFKALG